MKILKATTHYTYKPDIQYTESNLNMYEHLLKSKYNNLTFMQSFNNPYKYADQISELKLQISELLDLLDQLYALKKEGKLL